MKRTVFLLSLLVFCLSSTRAEERIEKLDDGIVVTNADGTFLKIEVRADDIVRVACAHDRKFFSHPSLVVEPRRGPLPSWKLTNEAGVATLATAKLLVHVDLATGAVSFADTGGRVIAAELPGGREIVPVEVQGEKTFNVRQQWRENSDEALFGLGQHQLGLMNIKGYDLDLWQHNTTVTIPFLVSSRGYGILWDNTSYTRFGDTRPFEAIPAAQIFDAHGDRGAFTGSYFSDAEFGSRVGERRDERLEIAFAENTRDANVRVHPALPERGDFSARWEGEIEPTTSGEYQFQTYSNSGIKLWIDDRLVIDHWRQGWLPWYDVARVRLEADAGRRYRLKLEWRKDQNSPTVALRWKTPSASAATSLWSEVSDGIDYTFIYGPDLDRVVAGYRRVTGAAPMMPRWVFGLWQSRQRYETAQQLTDALEGFRSRGFPLDAIVQDWRYWKDEAWGSHEFDATRFPDPEKWIRDIHEKYHAHVMISVWPKFYPGTKNFEEMNARGFLFQRNLDEKIRDWVGFPYTFYDAFNADARALFWTQMDRELFRKGIDAWWLDASEPDLTRSPTLDGQRAYVHPTALGTGSRVLNAYPLENSRAVWEGQRAAAPNQRVFILTRSAFAGQQRYAAATWSGDITSTWTAMRKQISAGASFSLSGLPYWTMDIGGYAVPLRFLREPSPGAMEEWRELNARWFEFGTFVPLLRVHGESLVREPWEMGGESHPAYQAELKFDRLRYRLLPYIYSLAGAVTQEGATMMRPLAMDFRDDAIAREVTDQFMFGPAFLVSPVTTYQARSRAVFLPATKGGWFDFWSGAPLTGGRSVDVAAPLDAMPVHVRAGSIIPTGPELQYAAEKPADPITLYVYAGADGAFSLYEDDGATFDYERGAFSRIAFRWNDAMHTLTIGAREGVFPDMLAERTFQIVLVSSAKPVGFSFSPTPDRVVRYSGAPLEVKF